MTAAYRMSHAVIFIALELRLEVRIDLVNGHSFFGPLSLPLCISSLEDPIFLFLCGELLKIGVGEVTRCTGHFGPERMALRHFGTSLMGPNISASVLKCLDISAELSPPNVQTVPP